jgi:hypothetical protein
MEKELIEMADEIQEGGGRWIERLAEQKETEIRRVCVCVFVHLVQQEGQWAVDYSRVWTPQSTKFWKRGITSHNEPAETTTVNLNTGTTTANTPLAENQSSLANT